MALLLKQSTAVVISFGPFLLNTDGVTLVTNLVGTGANQTENTSTGIRISKNGGAFAARHATATASTYDAFGNYLVTLDTTDTGTVGVLRMQFANGAAFCPVWMDFEIVPANIYDSIVGGTDILDVSMTQILGTAVSTPATAGILNVNVKNMNNVAGTSITAVNANVGTTQPINFTGTGASALAKSDMVDVAGAAVSTSVAQIGVNAVNIGGTAQTGRDLGASVLLSSGTGTGQLDFTSGVVKANLAQILGTALTETAGLLAGAFKKFFNVATPTGTVNSIPDAVAGAAGGIAIVGSNMGTVSSVTGAVGSVTGNVGGNVVGSVGSVVGAVGSVTGNVGGNVNGNVVGSVASVSGNVGGNVVGTLGGMTAAALADFFDTDSGKVFADAVSGSVVKEIADNAGGSSLTVQDIVDGVWDEPIADHLDAGSTGEALDSASTGGDPWSTALPGAYNPGEAGYIVSTKLDVAVSTRTIPGDQMTLGDGAITANTFFGNSITAGAISDDAVDRIQNGLATGIQTTIINNRVQLLPLANENADALLKRDWTAISGEASRSVLNALRFIRNKFSTTASAGFVTVYKEDDSTVAYTKALVTDATADPIVEG